MVKKTLEDLALRALKKTLGDLALRALKDTCLPATRVSTHARGRSQKEIATNNNLKASISNSKVAQ